MLLFNCKWRTILIIEISMIYLSEVLGGRVSDTSDVVVGRLKDIIIHPTTRPYPAPQLLVVHHQARGADFYIPYEYVANVSRGFVTLKTLLKNVVGGTPADNDIWLQRDVLDQQIVDVEGARVVRVNDLKLGTFEDEMSVLGIDISFKGILRRLGVAVLDIFGLFKVTLIDWRKAQVVGRVLKLDTISKDLTKLHPADLANIIEDLTVKHGSRLVRSLGPEAAAHVLEELDPHIQKTLINYLGPERAAGIMQEMSIDETVDLLKLLPRVEASKFLSYLQGSKLKKVEKLISYPDDTAGGLMTTEYLQARPDWTVEQATAEVRQLSPKLRSIMYLYITDEEGIFKGSVSVRQLLLGNPGEMLKNIMKRLHKRTVLTIDQSIKEVIMIMTKYDLYTAAVLDKDHKLVGVVTIDDVMRHLVPNA